MPTHFPPLYSDIADLAGKDLPNPVPTILATVLVLLVVFIGANVGLWWWAQKNAPAKPKKKVGAKQMKRETLRRGLAMPQD
ncbi:hypothetical protein MNEG_11574 [Monoraphidium neglectum]|uniref:Uncharacterized protein n=1 Tax=Monoraphidium neglectum TaxID=145388 RepID=A0A0D2MNV5_9CHLO|nr:hypothetical protein MNEG_11574 [Monoraphidium neglectum]KIY96390.1 hypothetical protein MNEG_11574 [Monoraphidium neglectum]|eukprot:XP_013895410.1 hypothetical protein MNEG_11574 [Monoraphidium neglectum]